MLLTVHIKNQSIFSYRRHNAIYFQVIVQRRQTAFHAEQQKLGSTGNVSRLQKVHHKEHRLVKDSNFSENGGILKH